MEIARNPEMMNEMLRYGYKYIYYLMKNVIAISKFFY